MKITNIEAIHLRVEDPNIGLFDGSYDDCVIRVSTDEGIMGIGEVESLAPAIQAIVNAAPAHNHARGRLRLGNIKFAADPWWMADLDQTARLLTAARGVLGKERGMIVDAALSYRTADDGLRLIPILKDADVMFLEAPLPLDDMDG